jgi:hypothetical protein
MVSVPAGGLLCAARENVNHDRYRTYAEFIDDFRLIFSNAILYNKPGTQGAGRGLGWRLRFVHVRGLFFGGVCFD